MGVRIYGEPIDETRQELLPPTAKSAKTSIPRILPVPCDHRRLQLAKMATARLTITKTATREEAVPASPIQC